MNAFLHSRVRHLPQMNPCFKTLVFLLLAAFAGSARAVTVTEAEMVGVWRVDPSTFRARDRTQTMPTIYTQFALSLEVGGTFIATNVPSEFFFGRPAVPLATGTWKITEKDSFTYFDLSFEKPAPGGLGIVVEWKRRTPWSSAKPMLKIYMGKKPDKSDVRWVYLTKEN